MSDPKPFDIEIVKQMLASEPRQTVAMARLEATVLERDRLRADVNAAELRGQDMGLALARSQVREWLARLELVGSTNHVHDVRESMKAFLAVKP